MRTLMGALFVACALAGACVTKSRDVIHEVAPDALQGIAEFDQVHLGFELGGRVVEISIAEGDMLEASRVVARLDDALERVQKEVHEAELRAAKAQEKLVQEGSRSEEIRAVRAELKAAQAAEGILSRTLRREKDLWREGVSTAARVDALEAELAQAGARVAATEQRWLALKRGARAPEVDAAEARVLATETAIKAADTRLAKHALTSPIDGFVADVHVSEGEVVAPGAPVVTLLDLKRPFADVFIPAPRIATVREGQSVSVLVDGLTRPLSGRVQHIAREAEFTPRFLFSERERINLVFRVRVRIDDPEHHLRAGLPVFVTPAADASPTKPSLPKEAKPS